MTRATGSRVAAPGRGPRSPPATSAAVRRGYGWAADGSPAGHHPVGGGAADSGYASQLVLLSVRRKPRVAVQGVEAAHRVAHQCDARRIVGELAAAGRRDSNRSQDRSVAREEVSTDEIANGTAPASTMSRLRRRARRLPPPKSRPGNQRVRAHGRSSRGSAVKSSKQLQSSRAREPILTLFEKGSVL